MPQDTRKTESGEKLPQCRSVALIAVGSNVASGALDPARTVQSGLEQLPKFCCNLMGVSDLFATAAYPLGSGPDFVNAAAVVETALDPNDLLQALHAIERHFGRVRHTRWAPRSLDLDLLAFGSLILPDPETVERWQNLSEADQRRLVPDELILPHPRLEERAFVLVPLKQALNRARLQWRHPVTGRSVGEMLKALDRGEIDTVRPL